MTFKMKARHSPSLRRIGHPVALLLFAARVIAQRAVPVPWSNRQYGYDGPWNAVTTWVGGFMNGTTPADQWVAVDLMPGGFWDTYIPTPEYCHGNNATGLCGIGGVWEPGENQTQGGQAIDFMPTIAQQSTSGLYATGYVYAQNWNVPGLTNPVPNATLVAISDGNMTLPNGINSSIELGTLSLGEDPQYQLFSFDTKNASDPGVYTWSVPGYLYNQSVTKSYSYGIHIGSAALNYPGSLLFGGYDKGRAIGPATSWGDTPPQLLDIVMGTETGGSPFSFSSQNNLLLDSSNNHNQLPVYPDPSVPYLHLPQQTCDKIVSYLPVFYDSRTHYYIWNTSDPSYKNITSSAAYLGFVFPPATGDTSDVTIKVPFALLNLTLTNPAVGSGKVTYFPCRSYTPQGNGPATGGAAAESYLLGRAFLQAAFVGRNWNRHVSWLAQAPGPGPANQGMGQQLTDILDSDTTLNLYQGDDYFNKSWAGHWSPLPGPTPSQPSANTTPSNNGGLSTGAKAGIGVGAAAVGVLAIGLFAFLFMRRKRAGDRNPEREPFVAYGNGAKEGAPLPQHGQQSYSDHPSQHAYMGSPPQGYAQPMYDPNYQNTAYLPFKPPQEQQEIPMHELHAGTPKEQGRMELPADMSPTELEVKQQLQGGDGAKSPKQQA